MEGSLDGGGLAGCLQALGWRCLSAWMEGGWLGWLDGAGACWGGGGLDKRLDGGEDGMEGAWLDGGGLGLAGGGLGGGGLDGGGPG